MLPHDKMNTVASETGELLIMVNISSNCLFEVVVAGDDVQIVKAFGKVSEAERKGAAVFVRTRRLRQQATDFLEETLVKTISESWLEVTANHVTKNTLRIATDLHLSTATLNVRDEDIVRVQKLLLNQGLKPFIRDDPTLARVLAAVGLMNTISTKVSTIVGLSGAFLKLKPDTLHNSIDQLLAHNGLPLLFESEDNLFALV